MDFSQPGLPMLSLGDGQPEFDYGLFMPEEDVDYLAEDSSTSSHNAAELSPQALVMQPITPPAERTPTAQQLRQQQQQKQRLERRGHTKSRRGCFNCKRRRIKCQETRPACGHCVKTGLQCEYPAAPRVVHQPQHQIPLFSLQDMRFFQHFLLNCTPHHPIGAESIWTHEIPCLSERHEYLMHALLGLAASDMMEQDPSLVTAAMHHRIKAIRAVKKSLSEVPKANTFEEGNALIATCFALTFQSVVLEDGMAEYMTFIRGVIIVAIQMYLKGSRLIFGNFLGDQQQRKVQPHMECLPLLNQSWVEPAVAAIENLAPLCQDPIEKEYQEKILDMAVQLRVSSYGAYKSLTTHYGWWMMLPHEDFQRIINTTNQTNVLLAAHWIALKQIMGSILEKEYDAGGPNSRQPSQKEELENGMLRWLGYLNRLVDAEHAAYCQWPIWVDTQLRHNSRFFGKTK